MKIIKTALAVTGAIALSTIALPAFATDAPEPEVWQAWITPLGSTPENVLYDQIVDTPENRATLECNTTYLVQNDKYLQSERDRFVADGKLTYKEDWGNENQRGAISWYFTEFTTDPCPVVLTPVTPIAPTLSRVDCTSYSVTLPYVENGRWLEHGPGPVVLTLPPGEFTFGFQTAEGNFTLNGADGFYLDNGTAYYTLTVPSEVCDIPPTEEPSPEPETTVPPAVTPPTATETPEATIPVSERTTLAETGPEDDARLLIFGGLSALALILVGGYMLFGRRDTNDNDEN